MRATLIEIVDKGHGIPDSWWYAKHPRLRVWAEKTQGVFCGQPAWRVIPGQEIPGENPMDGLWIDEEHAWSVREGEVELKLVEIEQ